MTDASPDDAMTMGAQSGAAPHRSKLSGCAQQALLKAAACAPRIIAAQTADSPHVQPPAASPPRGRCRCRRLRRPKAGFQGRLPASPGRPARRRRPRRRLPPPSRASSAPAPRQPAQQGRSHLLAHSAGHMPLQGTQRPCSGSEGLGFKTITRTQNPTKAQGLDTESAASAVGTGVTIQSRC